MKIHASITNGALFSIGALSVLACVWGALAAWNSSMSEAVSGTPLTASGWNAVVTNVNDLNSRMATALSRPGGSTITRWGAGSATANSTLLYTGWGFWAHYTHNWGSQPTCIQSGDPGGTASSTTYGDLLYPMGTGDAARMPPGVTAERHIRCAKLYVEAPTVEVYGSSSCPSGWSSIYSGYQMGEYYGHAAGKGIPMCVDANEFDASRYWNWASGGSYTAGSYLWGTSDATNYPTNRWVKCAVCGKF